MEKFQQFLERALGPVMAKLGSNRYLLAVRDGVIGALPIIIVGSFFTILTSPPIPQDWELYKFLTSNSTVIMLPYRMTMYIMALYSVFGMGHSLSRSFGLDALSGGILSVMAFLLTIQPVNIAADAAEAAGVSGFVVPMTNLGSSGLFVGIVVTFIAVNVYRLTTNSKFKISMPEQVPPAIANSFEALTPTLVVVLLIGGLTYWVGFDWHSIMTTLISPLVLVSDTLPAVLIVVFLNRFLWFFGIHGASIVSTVIRPLWLVLLEQNAAAAAAGVAGTQLPAIGAEPFYQWFVWTNQLGLPILLLTVCHSKYLREVGKVGIVPALFNIGEPLMFGVPLMLNMTLVIPFILAPVACACVSWGATVLGLVNRVTVTAPWTLPGPIGAFLATGGDWRAVVLAILCVLIAIVIYYPFVKMYDKQMSKEEGSEEAEASVDAA